MLRDMLRWITRKVSHSTQDVRCAPSSRVAGPWSRSEGLGVVRKINQPFKSFQHREALPSARAKLNPKRHVSFSGSSLIECEDLLPVILAC